MTHCISNAGHSDKEKSRRHSSRGMLYFRSGLCWWPRALLFRTWVSYVEFMLWFQTGLTTTVRIHLVKKIGTGTIDQGEEDPDLQGIAAWRPPLGSADPIMKTCGLPSSHWWLHWLHCLCTLDFVTCKISELWKTWICRNLNEGYIYKIKLAQVHTELPFPAELVECYKKTEHVECLCRHGKRLCGFGHGTST